MTNQLHDGAAYDPFLPARWTEIAHVPGGPRTRLGTPITRALFRAAVRDLPVRVEYPDGTVQGPPVRPTRPHRECCCTAPMISSAGSRTVV